MAQFQTLQDSEIQVRADLSAFYRLMAYFRMTD